MIATQRNPYRSATGVGSSSRTFKADVNDVLGSGQFYVTPEIEREFRSLHNGVEHLKLDATLQNTSPEWSQKFNSSTLAHEKSGAASTLSKVNGAVFDYKTSMDKNNLAKMQENEIRELHHYHMKNLIGVKGDMRPYAKESYNRIRQFSDHIGVTDRYTGYRNNLTRGSRDPFQLDTYWMRDVAKNKPVFASDGFPRAMTAPVKNTFNQYRMTNLPDRRPDIGIQSKLRAATAAPAHVPTVRFADTTGAVGQKMEKGPCTQSIQEACGINMVFPGKSEYKIRYSQPPPDQKTSPFIINPAPNFHVYGRPLAKLEIDPSFTEYQTRYQWPDGSKIIKLPWLKK